jgi:hypothetical protein
MRESQLESAQLAFLGGRLDPVRGETLGDQDWGTGLSSGSGRVKHSNDVMTGHWGVVRIESWRRGDVGAASR